MDETTVTIEDIARSLGLTWTNSNRDKDYRQSLKGYVQQRWNERPMTKPSHRWKWQRGDQDIFIARARLWRLGQEKKLCSGPIPPAPSTFGAPLAPTVPTVSAALPVTSETLATPGGTSAIAALGLASSDEEMEDEVEDEATPVMNAKERTKRKAPASDAEEDDEAKKTKNMKKTKKTNQQQQQNKRQRLERNVEEGVSKLLGSVAEVLCVCSKS